MHECASAASTYTTRVVCTSVVPFPHAELEPERLAEERKCVLNSTQKLAFNNYQTFIETADCTRVVFKDVREERRDRGMEGKEYVKESKVK